ncbi:MAG: helix-turn-helix transcriptional regulator [Clostridium sp.]
MNTKIQKLRKDLKLTQEQFGNRLGVSRNAIANIESGRVIPSELFLKALSKEFNIAKEWFETGNENLEKTLSQQDIKLADIFAKLTLDGSSNKTKKMKNLIETLSDLEEEYIDALEILTLGLINQKKKAK